MKKVAGLEQESGFVWLDGVYVRSGRWVGGYPPLSFRRWGAVLICFLLLQLVGQANWLWLLIDFLFHHLLGLRKVGRF